MKAKIASLIIGAALGLAALEALCGIRVFHATRIDSASGELIGTSGKIGMGDSKTPIGAEFYRIGFKEHPHEKESDFWLVIQWDNDGGNFEVVF